MRLASRAQAAAVPSERSGRRVPIASSGSTFAARPAVQPAQARTGRPGRVRDAETIQLLLCSPVTRERTSPGVISLVGDGGIAHAQAHIGRKSAAAFAPLQCPSVPPVGKMAQRLLGAPGNVRQPRWIVARTARNGTSVTSHTRWTLARPDGWAALRASPYGPGGNDRPWPARPAVPAVTGRDSCGRLRPP